MSCTRAPQIVCMSRLETLRASIDLTGKLRSGVTLTGTVTLGVSPSGPTIEAGTINVAAVTISGTEVAIGKAVTFLITGGDEVTAGTYIITVSCATTDNETVRLECTLTLE